MPRLMKPTATNLVLAALRARDDFMNQPQIREALPGVSANEISAALYHLRNHRAVDVVVEPDGEGWWFALPPEYDNRMRTIAEVPQGVKRNRRKKAKKEDRGGRMSRTQFLNDPDDVQWLLDTHLRGHALPFRPASFVLYGNEDAPDKVDLYPVADAEIGDACHTVIFT